jgi:iron complex transport system substrate-binding protein
MQRPGRVWIGGTSASIIGRIAGSTSRTRYSRTVTGTLRVCSFLPSATEIIAQLGLADSLVGVSQECRWPPEVVGTPVVTSARLDPAELTSLAIDRRVRAALAEGRSLYTVDAELVDRLAPDVIVTQDLCAVCAVSSGDLRSICPVDARVVSLDPRTLADVADTVELLAGVLGVPAAAGPIVAGMWSRIAQVREAVSGRRPRRMFLAEWIDPVFYAGHWLPEMIQCAGGVDVIGRAGEPSSTTTWDDVLSHAPELVVIAPCGFDAGEAARRAADLELPCPAVAVDGDSYYSRPSPRLAEGVEQLAHLLHPDLVDDPGLPAIELAMGPAKPGS